MPIRLLARLALAGIVSFLVLLVIYLVISFLTPHILVTFEFARRMRPYALAGAGYCGLALAYSHAITVLQVRQKSSKRKFREYLRRQAGMLLTIALISLGIGWMTYQMIVNIPASLLHRNAAKQTVVLEVTGSSTWPARKSLRGDCRYHLIFHEPRISPSIQYVCLTGSQWAQFRDMDGPFPVTLYGHKSEYGYDLRPGK